MDGIIPTFDSNHNTDLRSNFNDTVAMLLAYKGI